MYFIAPRIISRSSSDITGLFFSGRSIEGSDCKATTRKSHTNLHSLNTRMCPAWQRSNAPAVMPTFFPSRISVATEYHGWTCVYRRAIVYVMTWGIVGVIVVYLFSSIRILRQYERGVVFLLGKFTGVRQPGLTFIFFPFQTMERVSMRTVTMQIASQKIITKDNVSIDIAAVAYYRVTDPEKAVIAIENVYDATNQISQTTVRNVVGQFSLDQLLAQTSKINEQIKTVIDAHTEPWGAQVTAVEIKDIALPDNMQRAMAKEAEAERERRAKIVAAEGEFQAAVKLGEAADIISAHPVALQLRTLQTMAEISVEKNSTIIFPAQFMTTVHEAIKVIKGDSATK